MGALSPMHLALVLVIALLVFGPKKLPEIGKELGKAIREFKRASRDVMNSFHDALEDRPHPVSTYDPPALSAYHEPEDALHQAAEASSLGEPAAAAETPLAPATAPAGTIERPPHSPASPAVEKPAAPVPEAGPVVEKPSAPAPEIASALAEPGRVDAKHGSADLPVGGAADRKVGAAIDQKGPEPQPGQEPAKTAERTA